MTWEEKIGKTLGELGASDAPSVEALFSEVRDAIERERRGLMGRARSGEDIRGKPVQALRDRWLARRNGVVSRIEEHWLKAAPKHLKPAVGRAFNELRGFARSLEVEELLRDAPAVKTSGSSVEEQSDLTLPGNRQPLGSIHPVTRVEREIEEIFLRLGFFIETGPEIETVYYNFDALNIPESHPSRDDWDTLYIDAETVLRTHTSPVQIRAMRKYGAPLYVVIPGKCYRNDKPDATHSPIFHQMEGLAIDRDITFADLKGTIDFVAKSLLGEKTRTSFTPSFFPFTEPSGEVAASCFACDGRGCRTCKGSGWIELGGCGMMHPEVLRHGGIDPDEYAGWAFGLGLDRYAMIKYGIDDIQLFFQSDLRFLEQF